MLQETSGKHVCFPRINTGLTSKTWDRFWGETHLKKDEHVWKTHYWLVRVKRREFSGMIQPSSHSFHVIIPATPFPTHPATLRKTHQKGSNTMKIHWCFSPPARTSGHIWTFPDRRASQGWSHGVHVPFRDVARTPRWDMALDLIKTRNWDSPECALEFSVILTDCMVNSTKIAENWDVPQIGNQKVWG